MVENALQEIQNADITPNLTSQKGFELIQRAAHLLAKSSLVPREYQNNLPNCVIALNMAARMDADALMIMQNLFIVNGRPSWSSQFLIATFNTSGRFSALRYEWEGKENTDEWGCRAWAIEKDTGERLSGSLVTIGLAKKEGWYQKNGSKWQTMPQQMLMYRAAAWFIRSYAPELAMGMHTVDEVSDFSSDDYRVIDQEIEQNANAEIIDLPGNQETGTEQAPEQGTKPKTEPPQAGKEKHESGLFPENGPGF